MPSKSVAAFFDFDKTIIDGDSQGLEIKYYARKGQLGPARLLKLAVLDILYKRGLIPAVTMVRQCIQSFQGWQLETLERQTADLFASEMLPRFRPQIVSLIREHQEMGHWIVLVSASVQHLVTPASAELGADHVFCTELEATDQGVLTGRSAGPICIGEQKKYRAQMLADTRSINLADSYAYSDHHADLPLLEAVGHPVAVDPTQKLARIAHKRKWPIITCETSEEEAGYALDFGWHSKRE